jgi:phage host-nuclease inhibitor protein Gam
MLWISLILLPIICGMPPPQSLTPTANGLVPNGITGAEAARFAKGYFSTLAYMLLPYSRIEGLEDFISQGMVTGVATEAILQSIKAKRGINGFVRNPLAVAIQMDRTDIVKALLKAGADVKGTMQKKRFSYVYGYQDPIDMLLGTRECQTQIPEILPLLLKAYSDQYPSQFRMRAIGVLEQSLDKPEKTLILASRLVRKFQVQVPVYRAIYDWVDEAYKKGKRQTLNLIFKEIIGAPENLGPVLDLYKEMKELPNRDASALQHLRRSIDKVQEEIASLTQTQQKEINTIKAEFDPQIKQIMADSTQIKNLQSEIRILSQKILRLYDHSDMSPFSHTLRSLQRAHRRIYGHMLRQGLISHLQQQREMLQQELHRIDSHPEAYLSRQRDALAQLQKTKEDRIQPLKNEVDKLAGPNIEKIAAFKSEMNALQNKQRADIAVLIRRIKDLEEPRVLR